MRRIVRKSRWTWGEHENNPMRGVRITSPHARVYVPYYYLRDIADFLHEAADDLDAIERGEPVDYRPEGHGFDAGRQGQETA